MDFQSLRQKYNLPDDTSATAMANALRVVERRGFLQYDIPNSVPVLVALKTLDAILGSEEIANWLTSALRTGATINKTLLSSKEKGKSPTRRVTRSMSKAMAAKDSPSSSTFRVDKEKGQVVTDEEIEAEFKIKPVAERHRDTLSKMSKMPIAYSYKLCVVGDRGTGKTTFLNQHLGGVSRKVSINGNDCVYPIDFDTCLGRICFNAVDSVRDENLLHGDCAIIMFDVHSLHSLARVSHWYRLIRQICGNIPIVVCGNKIDIVSKKSIRTVPFPRTYTNIRGVEVSALAGGNFAVPFMYLANTLTDDDRDLELDPDSYTLSEPGPEVPTVLRYNFDYNFRWDSRP